MPPTVRKVSPRQTKVVSPVEDPWELNQGMRLLLYGQSGTGKTTLWATFPGPILCLLCSGGSKPGELRSINTPEYREKITPRVIRAVPDVFGLLEDAATYGTVVLDHVSGLCDLALKEILGVDELPAQKSWGMASQQQYGQMALQVKDILRKLLNLPGNCVIVAQERVFTPKEEGSELIDVIKPTVGPALTPSLAGWLNPAVDYILQTYKRPRMVPFTTKVAGKDHVTMRRGKGAEYCVRCEVHDVFTTKFRVPKGLPLPECIVDPTYDRIQSVIAGEPLEENAT